VAAFKGAIRKKRFLHISSRSLWFAVPPLRPTAWKTDPKMAKWAFGMLGGYALPSTSLEGGEAAMRTEESRLGTPAVPAFRGRRCVVLIGRASCARRSQLFLPCHSTVREPFCKSANCPLHAISSRCFCGTSSPKMWAEPELSRSLLIIIDKSGPAERAPTRGSLLGPNSS